MNKFKNNQLVLVTDGFSENYKWIIASYKSTVYREEDGKDKEVVYYMVHDYTNYTDRSYYHYCIPYEGNEDKLNQIPKREDLKQVVNNYTYLIGEDVLVNNFGEGIWVKGRYNYYSEKYDTIDVILTIGGFEFNIDPFSPT